MALHIDHPTQKFGSSAPGDTDAYKQNSSATLPVFVSI